MNYIIRIDFFTKNVFDAEDRSIIEDIKNLAQKQEQNYKLYIYDILVKDGDLYLFLDFLNDAEYETFNNELGCILTDRKDIRVFTFKLFNK